MAYKVFTNGSTLQASELNENLMKQSVAVFSNAAARTAAITSPVEGQMTYLEDTNLYAMWNGSAWVTPFGSTLLANVSFTNATTVNVDNVFSSAYRNYKIDFQQIQGSAGGQIRFRLRNGGSTISTNTYHHQGVFTANGSNGVTQSVNAGEWNTQGVSVGENYFATFGVFNPALAINTGISLQGFSVESGIFIGWNTNGQERTSSARDGFHVLASAGNMTGNIKVYGLKDGF